MTAYEFGATTQATGILDAMTDLPGLLDVRTTAAVPAGYLDARRTADDVVPAGWWQRLVYSAGCPEGTVDRAAYVSACSSSFIAIYLRRDIYASPSARWGDPRSKLLTRAAWDAARGPALHRSGCPKTQASCSPSTPKSSTVPGKRSRTASSPDRRSMSTAKGLHADKIDAIADPFVDDDRRRVR